VIYFQRKVDIEQQVSLHLSTHMVLLFAGGHVIDLEQSRSLYAAPRWLDQICCHGYFLRHNLNLEVRSRAVVKQVLEPLQDEGVIMDVACEHGGVDDELAVL
jgi:hypothetical protein